MKTIIAHTKLYKFKNNNRSVFQIKIYQPNLDRNNTDYLCCVSVTGKGMRKIYGIDSFQALNLAFVYIHSIANELIINNVKLYFDKNSKFEFDIKSLILHDHSKYLKYTKNIKY